MRKVLMMLVMAAGLAACGGGGGSEASTAPAPAPIVDNTPVTPVQNTMTALTVVGTSASDAAGVAPISPTVNGGAFTVKWSASKPVDIQVVSFFISPDDTLSDTDILFFKRKCGGVLGCASAENVSDCSFANSGKIACAGGDVDGASLTTFLTTIPRDGFLIARTCDISGFTCDVKKAPVQFQ